MNSIVQRFFGYVVLWIGILGLGCESTHETYQGDSADDLETEESLTDLTDDTVLDLADDDTSPSVAEVVCGAEDPVSVEGTLSFDGTYPDTARLWVVWMTEIGTPGMPPCFGEIEPFDFPVDFRILQVPRDATWDLVLLLDADGFFPPLPAEGDYWAPVQDDELDLSDDVTGLALELEPYIASE